MTKLRFSREYVLFSLIPQVADAVCVPVIAAGGIVDGRGMAAALSLGADGVQLGTRFVTATECIAHLNYKNAILKAADVDTIVAGRAIVPVRRIKSGFSLELAALERSGAPAGSLQQFARRAREAQLGGDMENGDALVEDYYEEFERVYDDRYQQQYGRWRPVIGEVMRKYLECGGFARLGCCGCRYQAILAYSCKCRLFCPSCQQKRVLLFAEWLDTHILEQVSHAQFVFTIPKLLRPIFKYHPKDLGLLCTSAWQLSRRCSRRLPPIRPPCRASSSPFRATETA